MKDGIACQKKQPLGLDTKQVEVYDVYDREMSEVNGNDKLIQYMMQIDTNWARRGRSKVIWKDRTMTVRSSEADAKEALANLSGKRLQNDGSQIYRITWH